MADTITPAEAPILQSPHTKVAIKRMSERISAVSLEEAASAWAAMQAAKKEKRERYQRQRAENKHGQLEVRVVAFVG